VCACVCVYVYVCVCVCVCVCYQAVGGKVEDAACAQDVVDVDHLADW